MPFARIGFQKNVIPDKEDIHTFRMLQSLVSRRTLLAFLNLEKLHRNAPRGMCKKCGGVVILTVADHDDFELERYGLFFEALQTPTQDVRSLVRGNDDGKFRHRMYDTPVLMSSLTFFIDLCSHRKIIACVDVKKTIALAEISDHTDEADLMPAIQRLLQSVDASMHDLKRIAAISGPGGFMSQRVEMSLANALSWGLKIPIAGIHLSDLWAARFSPPPSGEGSGVGVWLHSTQKSALFIHSFGEALKLWPEATLINLEDAKEKIPKESLIIGELIPEHLTHFTLLSPEKLKTIEDVLPALCEASLYGSPPILPWYGRGL